jgi:hypothetical protein
MIQSEDENNEEGLYDAVDKLDCLFETNSQAEEKNNENQ